MAKSKYFTHVEPMLAQVEEWANKGLTDEQIYKNLGISKDTFYKYKNKYSDFSDVLIKAKEKIQCEVEEALYKKATGYTYVEQQAIKLKEIYYDEQDRKCTNERVEIIEVVKEVAADTSAIKFYLLNRAKNRWTNDPAKLDIDKELLRLKKKEIESKAID